MLEEIRNSWDSLIALVRQLDQLSGSVDPMRMELLVLEEAGLSLKFNVVGLVYTHGYYDFFIAFQGFRYAYMFAFGIWYRFHLLCIVCLQI